MITMDWKESLREIKKVYIYISTARQRSCGKVILSVESVFHYVCPGGISHVAISHYALENIIQGPPSLDMETHHTATVYSSSLLPLLDMFSLVHYEEHTVGKRAVRIL